MKMLHLSDLHIGKRVNDISMIDDQEFILEQVVDLIKEKNIKALLIAGDVFDKQIASIGALELFEKFINKVLEFDIKIFIISGNHDNMDRLAFLSQALRKSNIYISKTFQGFIEKIEFDNKINIFLMPYLYPALIRKYYAGFQITDYNSAIKVLLDGTDLDSDKINILLAHQFVAGLKEPILSQSEQKSVGGVDMVTYEHFKKFDYVALGHLHCPQSVGEKNIRYGGSILKYSFSEINQNKSFTIIDVKDKNNIELEFVKIKFKHELKHYSGYLEEFLSSDFYSKINTNDYIYFTLFDENVIEAKKKLLSIYPNIMQLDFDNSFTRNLNTALSSNIKNDKTIFEHFCSFCKLQTGLELNEHECDIVKETIDEIKLKEQNICAL